MAGLRTGLTLLAPQHFCFQPIGEKKKKSHKILLPVLNTATPTGLEETYCEWQQFAV